MSKIRIRPYATPKLDRLSIDGWYGKQSEHGMIPINDILVDWDPAVRINVTVPLSLDVSGLYSDCYLNSDATIRVSLVWYSADAGLKGLGQYQIVEFADEIQHLNLAVSIDGTTLSKSVELSVVVTLQDPGKMPQTFAPKLRGCVLLRDSKQIQLEGEGARFPTEVIDFTTTHYPNGAGWALDWDPSDLEQSVLGDMRLYINANHARVKSAVSGENDQGSDIRESIRYDVARILIFGALRNKRFVENPEQFEEGSVGRAIYNLISQYFPDYSMLELSDQIQYPHNFEAKLQAKLKIYGDD